MSTPSSSPAPVSPGEGEQNFVQTAADQLGVAAAGFAVDAARSSAGIEDLRKSSAFKLHERYSQFTAATITAASGVVATAAWGPNLTQMLHGSGVASPTIQQIVTPLSFITGIGAAGTAGFLRHKITGRIIRSDEGVIAGFRGFVSEHPTQAAVFLMALLATEIPNAGIGTEIAFRSEDSHAQVEQFGASATSGLRSVSESYRQSGAKGVEELRALFLRLAEEEKNGSGITKAPGCGPMCRALEAMANGSISPEALTELNQPSKGDWRKQLLEALKREVGMLAIEKSKIENIATGDIAVLEVRMQQAIAKLFSDVESLSPDELLDRSEAIVNDMRLTLSAVSEGHTSRLHAAAERTKNVVIGFYRIAERSGQYDGFDASRLASFDVRPPEIRPPEIRGIEPYQPKNTLTLFKDMFQENALKAGGISALAFLWMIFIALSEPYIVRGLDRVSGGSEAKRRTLLKPFADRYEQLLRSIAEHVSRSIGTLVGEAEGFSLDSDQLVARMRQHFDTKGITASNERLSIGGLVQAFAQLHRFLEDSNAQRILLDELISRETVALIGLQRSINEIVAGFATPAMLFEASPETFDNILLSLQDAIGKAEESLSKPYPAAYELAVKMRSLLDSVRRLQQVVSGDRADVVAIRQVSRNRGFELSPSTAKWFEAILSRYPERDRLAAELLRMDTSHIPNIRGLEWLKSLRDYAVARANERPASTDYLANGAKTVNAAKALNAAETPILSRLLSDRLDAEDLERRISEIISKIKQTQTIATIASMIGDFYRLEFDAQDRDREPALVVDNRTERMLEDGRTKFLSVRIQLGLRLEELVSSSQTIQDMDTLLTTVQSEDQKAYFVSRVSDMIREREGLIVAFNEISDRKNRIEALRERIRNLDNEGLGLFKELDFALSAMESDVSSLSMPGFSGNTALFEEISSLRNEAKEISSEEFDAFVTGRLASMRPEHFHALKIDALKEIRATMLAFLEEAGRTAASIGFMSFDLQRVSSHLSELNTAIEGREKLIGRISAA